MANNRNRGARRRKASSPSSAGGKAENYRGVCQTDHGKFFAVLRSGGKRFASRAYGTKEEAAKAYDELAIKHHGSKAVTNFRRDQRRGPKKRPRLALPFALLLVVIAIIPLGILAYTIGNARGRSDGNQLSGLDGRKCFAAFNRSALESSLDADVMEENESSLAYFLDMAEEGNEGMTIALATHVGGFNERTSFDIPNLLRNVFPSCATAGCIRCVDAGSFPESEAGKRELKQVLFRAAKACPGGIVLVRRVEMLSPGMTEGLRQASDENGNSIVDGEQVFSTGMLKLFEFQLQPSSFKRGRALSHIRSALRPPDDPYADARAMDALTRRIQATFVLDAHHLLPSTNESKAVLC